MEVLLWLSVCVVGALDVFTGTELSFAPFYMPVVVAAAWRRGRLGGAVSALVCSAMGVLADHLLSGPFLTFSTSFSSPAVPWWNGLARLSVYLLVGLSIASLRKLLRERDALVVELREALSRVQTLQGLLPICAWCKHIRDDESGTWRAIEQYVSQRTAARFTHGICPGCAAQLVPEGARDAEPRSAASMAETARKAGVAEPVIPRIA